jgi:RimJ/RimL family protein N-acetyltransferase
MTLLQGPRVVLRPWRDEDLAPFAAIAADPEVMRHLSSTLTPDESDAFVQRVRDHFSANGFGLWAIEVPVIGFAGFVGVAARVPFALSLPGVEAHPHEIGWRLARAAWGRGYASEGARLALGHAFGELALGQVVSFTVPANTRSLAVVQRIGLTPRGGFEHPRFAPGHPLRRHALWAIDAGDFDGAPRAG